MRNLIIIPAYNVESKIKAVLDKLKSKKESVVVIDDGSTDKTSRIIEEENFQLIKHKKNMGLSQAIYSGLNYAKENNFEYVIIIDADGQHDPELIDKFISKFDSYDYVLGNRFCDISIIPSCKIASNLFASLIVYSITGKMITDVSCGYHGVKMDKLDTLIALNNCKNYEIPYERLFFLLKKNIKYSIVNIPVIYPCDELHCTKVDEIISLINVSIKYCSDQELLKRLKHVLDNTIKRNNFHVTIRCVCFYCFYISYVDSYIFQTDLNKATLFY